MKSPDGVQIFKAMQGTVEKFANTPENCFIVNDSVNDVRVYSKLNRQWYIDLTKERLSQFGVM